MAVPRWSRPETTVTAPDGATWEVYVDRPTGVRWQPSDYDVPDPYFDSKGGLVVAVIAIPLFVVNCIVVPAVRYLLSLPAGVVRSRRSTTWVVEAVCWWPHEQRFRWSVETSQRDRVTAEIVKGIGQGRWAQPTGAVFHGQVTG